MKFSVFQVSQCGGRSKNEDRMGYCFTRDAGLFVVADGMGGHPDGDMAAELALQTVSAYFQKGARPSVDSVPRLLSSALMAAHYQILRYAAVKGLSDTPRTTIVAALVDRGVAHWVHCGDSRLYLVRGGRLVTRTRDHSFSEHQDKFRMRPEHLNRNVLFTCLGSPQRPIFDVSDGIVLQYGDKLLLCSDGLWDALSDPEIVSHLAAAPVADAVPELVERALIKSGDSSDNVTVLALEWEASDEFEPTLDLLAQQRPSSLLQSTIQANAMDPSLNEMDDKAIERAISEINEAIRRKVKPRK